MLSNKITLLLALMVGAAAVMVLGTHGSIPLLAPGKRAAPAHVAQAPADLQPAPFHRSPRLHRAIRIPAIDDGTAPAIDRSETFFVVRQTQDDLTLVPMRQTVETPEPTHALAAMADFPREQGGLLNPLPQGARLLDLQLGADGTATANFSQELETNFHGGARSEQMAVYAIVDTLARFPNVKRVAIRVDGRPVDSIGGHIELTEPLEPDTSFITPQ